MIPDSYKPVVISVLRKIGSKMGSWLRSQFLLMLIMGFSYGIILSIFGVKFALTLAIIGAVLEIIPTIGPILTALLSASMALVDSPWRAFLVLIAFFILQQLENNFIVPKIMQKALGISPVFIIIAVLIGAKLLGILGAVLAVPLAGIAAVLIAEWPNIKASIPK